MNEWISGEIGINLQAVGAFLAGLYIVLNMARFLIWLIGPSKDKDDSQ
jgi:hypothetical protein